LKTTPGVREKGGDGVSYVNDGLKGKRAKHLMRKRGKKRKKGKRNFCRLVNLVFVEMRDDEERKG